MKHNKKKTSKGILEQSLTCDAFHSFCIKGIYFTCQKKLYFLMRNNTKNKNNKGCPSLNVMSRVRIIFAGQTLFIPKLHFIQQILCSTGKSVKEIKTIFENRSFSMQGYNAGTRHLNLALL